MRGAVVAIVLLATTAAPAWAQSGGTYHVDPDGVGGACGDARTAGEAASTQTPWCSIGRAAAAAPPGAVVLIRRSTIGEVELVGIQRAGRVTISPFPGESVAVEDVDFDRTSFVRLEGLTISDPPTVSAGSRQIELVDGVLPRGVQLVAGSGPVLIEGNAIANPVGTGVNFSAHADSAPIVDVTIRGNRFAGIARDAIQAKNFRNLIVEGNEFRGVRRTDPSAHPDVLQTVFGGQGLVFRSNWLHDYEAQGVFIADGGVSSVVIENNLIEDSDGPYSPVRVADAQGVSFVNNTVDGQARFSASSRDVTIANNIVGALDLDRSGGLTIDYEDHNLIESGGGDGPHDLAGPAGFRDRSAGDFELAAHSPAIDAGTSVGVPPLDMLGRSRVDDPAGPNAGVGPSPVFDLGALERGGLLPAVPSAPFALPEADRGEPPALGFRAFGVRAAPGQLLARVVARGLLIRVRCSTACRLRATASVHRRVAARIGLPRRRISRPMRARLVQIGKRRASLRRAGRRTLRIGLRPRARRALRRARGRTRVVVRVTAVGASGSRQTLRRTVSLRASRTRRAR